MLFIINKFIMTLNNIIIVIKLYSNGGHTYFYMYRDKNQNFKILKTDKFFALIEQTTKLSSFHLNFIIFISLKYISHQFLKSI